MTLFHFKEPQKFQMSIFKMVLELPRSLDPDLFIFIPYSIPEGVSLDFDTWSALVSFVPESDESVEYFIVPDKNAESVSFVSFIESEVLFSVAEEELAVAVHLAPQNLALESVPVGVRDDAEASHFVVDELAFVDRPVGPNESPDSVFFAALAATAEHEVGALERTRLFDDSREIIPHKISSYFHRLRTENPEPARNAPRILANEIAPRVVEIRTHAVRQVVSKKPNER